MMPRGVCVCAQHWCRHLGLIKPAQSDVRDAARFAHMHSKVDQCGLLHSFVADLGTLSVDSIRHASWASQRVCTALTGSDFEASLRRTLLSGKWSRCVLPPLL